MEQVDDSEMVMETMTYGDFLVEIFGADAYEDAMGRDYIYPIPLDLVYPPLPVKEGFPYRTLPGCQDGKCVMAVLALTESGFPNENDLIEIITDGALWRAEVEHGFGSPLYGFLEGAIVNITTWSDTMMMGTRAERDALMGREMAVPFALLALMRENAPRLRERRTAILNRAY